MKKFIIIVLAVSLIVLCFAGCSSAPANKEMTLDEFIEKYKRADIETLKTDPKQFFSDFGAVQKMVMHNEEASAQFLEWPDDETFKDMQREDTLYKEKQLVLYNQPAEMSVTLYKNRAASLFIKLQTGSAESDFELAKKMTDAMIKDLGDAEVIEVDREKTDEAALRKMFNGGMKSFHVRFSSPESEYKDLSEEEQNEYFRTKYYSYTISFHFYSGYSTTSSSVTFY